MSSEMPLVSIVVPVLNEEGCVLELVRRVQAMAEGCGIRPEILFVDDGSSDRTPEVVAEARERFEFVKSIRFSRSFGHQAALAAGLQAAAGEAVVTMDGDLQHPPETIAAMVEAWRQGASVVNTVRRDPGRDIGAFKGATARLFYHLFDLLTAVPTVHGGADFRLLDRAVADELNRLEEHFLFFRGLVPWLGFPSTTIEYEVGERFAGETKYRLRKMLYFAVDGIFSFSVVPLRAITLLGVATTLFGFLYGLFAVFSFLGGRLTEPGWTSLMVIVLIFGGVQLLSIGLVSEYLGRIYEEVKRRPRFVIRSRAGFGDDPPAGGRRPGAAAD